MSDGRFRGVCQRHRSGCPPLPAGCSRCAAAAAASEGGVGGRPRPPAQPTPAHQCPPARGRSATAVRWGRHTLLPLPLPLAVRRSLDPLDVRTAIIERHLHFGRHLHQGLLRSYRAAFSSTVTCRTPAGAVVHPVGSLPVLHVLFLVRRSVAARAVEAHDVVPRRQRRQPQQLGAGPARPLQPRGGALQRLPAPTLAVLGLWATQSVVRGGRVSWARGRFCQLGQASERGRFAHRALPPAGAAPTPSGAAHPAATPATGASRW
jgi:hypothetical protein